MSNFVSTSNSTRSVQPFPSHKLTEFHLERDAVLYVRQSTSRQLRDHQESTARQYHLTERLAALGWPHDRIIVIDDDLGISGAGTVDRPGFRRLLNLVTEQRTGIVLGLEMSRLARNSKDWHHLFEVCAIYGTLIADEDGVFDPNDPNDRLVLGLKGIISEMELHTMRVRLERGRLNKAQRGELFHELPVGYTRDELGRPRLDPDESARHVMTMFFSMFETIGSAHGLFHHLSSSRTLLPFRDRGGLLAWKLPSKSTVAAILKHPLYAGAYGYGRRANYKRKRPGQAGRKDLPMEQWKVLLRNLYPSYITWDQYESNLRRLASNDTRRGRGGAPRRGGSLLTGIVFCASCGRRLSTIYDANGRGSYHCGRHRTQANAVSCRTTLVSRVVDDLVAAKILQALAPASIDLSLRVVEDETTRREQLETLSFHRRQRAQYEVGLAERRYRAVDPDNRLVAGSLERQWEAALRNLQSADQELEQLRASRPIQLGDAERRELVEACSEIEGLWRGSASIEERKEIVRLLIEKVVVQVHDDSDRAAVWVHWFGGFENHYQFTRPVSRFYQLTAYDELIEFIIKLTKQGASAAETAGRLAAEGYSSPRSQGPISASMVEKLLLSKPCAQQLSDPELLPGDWRAEALAHELGMPTKRLKDWVTRGWATAIQRPHGRTWVIYADEMELSRLRRLVETQSGRGSPAPDEALRTPGPVNRE